VILYPDSGIIAPVIIVRDVDSLEISGLSFKEGKGRSFYNNYSLGGAIYCENSGCNLENIVFEDMKSSGKTFLIKSDSLREKIQIYYRLFNEVIKREELNIENIGKYNDHINSQIKISPLIENGFPERWNASVKINNPNSFKNSWNSFNEKQKNVFKENYSLIKITIIGSHTIRLKLYNAGTELIESIDQYLKNEK
jgi:hypothetical protein